MVGVGGIEGCCRTVCASTGHDCLLGVERTGCAVAPEVLEEVWKVDVGVAVALDAVDGLVAVDFNLVGLVEATPLGVEVGCPLLECGVEVVVEELESDLDPFVVLPCGNHIHVSAREVTFVCVNRLPYVFAYVGASAYFCISVVGRHTGHSVHHKI